MERPKRSQVDVLRLSCQTRPCGFIQLGPEPEYVILAKGRVAVSQLLDGDRHWTVSLLPGGEPIGVG